MSCRCSGKRAHVEVVHGEVLLRDPELGSRLAHLARERVRLEARRQRPRRDRERDVADLAAPSTSRAIVPPQPSSPSSVCGASTSARSSRPRSPRYSTSTGRTRNVPTRWSTRTPPRSPRSSERSAPSSCSSRATASPARRIRAARARRRPGSARSLVGDDDVERLVTEPAGLALVGVGRGRRRARRDPARALPGGRPGRPPRRCPVPDPRPARRRGRVPPPAALPRRSRPRSSRSPTACSAATRPAAAALLLALPLAAFVAFTAISFLWTWDEREGGIALAFFLFPFTAGFAVVARAPLATWLPRALARDARRARLALRRRRALAGADADGLLRPRRRGRERVHVVLPGHVALQGPEPVRPLPRRPDRGAPRRRSSSGRAARVDWVVAAALVAFLFWGLFFSYSQSSFVALFVVTFAVASSARAGGSASSCSSARPSPRVGAAAFAAQAVEGRSAREATSGRSRLVTVTLDAFADRPLAGVGVGGQPRASAERVGTGTRRAATRRTRRRSRARRGRRDRLRALPVAARRRGVGALLVTRRDGPSGSASRPSSSPSSSTRSSTPGSSRTHSPGACSAVAAASSRRARAA